jgi:hypothetical protein
MRQHAIGTVAERLRDPARSPETQLRDNAALRVRIAELEAENAWLRHAAGAFGELAERLNVVLQRRQSAELGSQALRPARDRRQSP